jgi:hypothetical protein
MLTMVLPVWMKVTFFTSTPLWVSIQTAPLWLSEPMRETPTFLLAFEILGPFDRAPADQREQRCAVKNGENS